MTADLILQAPAVVENHRLWIESRCEELRKSGYVLFRASFPDGKPRELYLEAWLNHPGNDQGPMPWERGGHDTHLARYLGPPSSGGAPSLSVQSDVGSLPERGAVHDPADPSAGHGDDRPSVAKRPYGSTYIKGHEVCLLDGEPVPKDGISHTRKRPDGQQTSYARMSDQCLKNKRPLRPVQKRYRHLVCLTQTEMHTKMAESLARDPKFYVALFCAKCKGHFKCGPDGEFLWDKSDRKVGT